MGKGEARRHESTDAVHLPELRLSPSKTESVFENSGGPPREGTRPTSFGRNARRLSARCPHRASFQTRSEI